MPQLDHVCGLDDESVKFDPVILKNELNEEWDSFLDRVWKHSFIPGLNSILGEYGQHVCLRQHVDPMKDNFYVLFRYVYNVIRSRMEPTKKDSPIVVDMHKLSGAGLFATLYLGPFALAMVEKEELLKQKDDIEARATLRDTRRAASKNIKITVGAKYANELLAFRVGCGISLTEMRYRSRVASENISPDDVDNPATSKERLDEIAAIGSSLKMVKSLKNLEMPKDYEMHILRTLSQSYFTGCFDILLWPHIFYWLQQYTMTPHQARKPLDSILNNLNSGF
ncbi:MAG: hypothetical protein HQL69_02120 [Magnetococcales bacterium]|nr:hypothetical protein [Magnetococcales bacterium]